MAASLDQAQHRSSPHETRVEGDVVFQRTVGSQNVEDIKHLFALSQAVYERYGYALILMDGSQSGVLTPEARKFQSDLFRKRILPSHTALYGSGLLVRTAVTLTMRATELMTGTVVPVTMVADEQTARQVLAEARERFRAQGIAKTLS